MNRRNFLTRFAAVTAALGAGVAGIFAVKSQNRRMLVIPKPTWPGKVWHKETTYYSINADWVMARYEMVIFRTSSGTHYEIVDRRLMGFVPGDIVKMPYPVRGNILLRDKKGLTVVPIPPWIPINKT